MFRFEGKTALVTGAGGGLGEAIADGLAQQGARVYGTSRSRATADRIAARYGTTSVVLDQAQVDSFDQQIGRVYEESGGIDLLCNNAGVNFPQRATEVSIDKWDAVQNVNVRGVFFLTQWFARRWIRTGIKGSVVNISSQAGTVAIEERAAYGASKAALSHLTRILALEWASAGIRVNAVAPTFVRTQLTESTLSRPGWASELTSRIPLGRLGTPEDVAASVIYLCSDEASMVTGHVLAVDGGYTIR